MTERTALSNHHTMNEDLEFFNLKPTPTQIRGYMEEERRKAFAKGYAEGKAYWEPSEAHKGVWREKARREALEEVLGVLPKEKPLIHDVNWAEGYNACRKTTIKHFDSLTK